MRDQHERAHVCLECLSNILSGREARAIERKRERERVRETGRDREKRERERECNKTAGRTEALLKTTIFPDSKKPD